MRSYLINLKRRPDRLAESLTQFATTSIKPFVVEAVDGHKQPLPANWTAGPGAYGCSLSHRKVLELAIANGEADVGICVYEDDVNFVKDFDAKFEQLMKLVPNTWDAIFLGGQHIELPIATSIPGLLRAENIHRTHAYIIRGKYLHHMLEAWKNESGHIDHIFGRHQKEWQVFAPTINRSDNKVVRVESHWLCSQREGVSDINGRTLRERSWQPKRVRSAKPPCEACKKKEVDVNERQQQKEAARAARRKQREEAAQQRKQLKQQRQDSIETRTSTEIPAPLPTHNPTFSIVLPSRERVELLTQLLNSIANTADTNRIEVLVGIDNDDTQTTKAVPDLQQRFPFVSFDTGARCGNLSAGYYNPLAKSSKGRYVMLLNDDCEFTKPGWDSDAIAVLDDFKKNHPDNIVLGKIADNTGCNYSCFPVLSRETINVLGWAQNPGFTSWGADVHLNKVFAPLGREQDLPIFLNHFCHHNNTRQRDHVNKQMARRSKQPYHLADADRARVKAALVRQ